MYNIFMTMMTGGHFSNEQKMVSELNGVYHLLGSQEHLTSIECDTCLLYFFREYSKGCSRPLTDDYIKRNLIPVVKNYPDFDLIGAISLMAVAKLNM